jgi:hypothetical protein
MSKPSIHQLLPSELDLNLFVWGDDPRPGDFLRLFRSTWGRLPPQIQTCILAQWRGSPLYRSIVDHQGVFAPVEISNTMKADCRRGAPGYAVALCHPVFKNLYYWTPHLYSLAEAQAERVIASELAHAWMLSFLTDLGELDLDGYAAGPERLLQVWGFPPDDGHTPTIRELMSGGARDPDLRFIWEQCGAARVGGQTGRRNDDRRAGRSRRAA